MNSIAKKIASYVLVTFVLIFTVLALLAIWDIIDIQDILQKTFLSLFVVFVSSVIVLFIFSVIIKDPRDKND
jgi:glucan phosphoethanolaminetransferase (alkaline phosphatase superfamily)